MVSKISFGIAIALFSGIAICIVLFMPQVNNWWGLIPLITLEAGLGLIWNGLFTIERHIASIEYVLDMILEITSDESEGIIE